jgi:uncharacterized membrane protein YtjA (UPF0391 family)
MLRLALAFLVLALVAGFFGIWGLEGMAMWMARITFFMFIVLFVVSLIFNRRTPLS